MFWVIFLLVQMHILQTLKDNHKKIYMFWNILAKLFKKTLLIACKLQVLAWTYCTTVFKSFGSIAQQFDLSTDKMKAFTVGQALHTQKWGTIMHIETLIISRAIARQGLGQAEPLEIALTHIKFTIKYTWTSP